MTILQTTIKTKKMNKYKIINLKTSKEFFLNEQETTNFFIKNKIQNYNIINLTELKRIKRNKILDNIALTCFFAAVLVTVALIIENFY
tara:strand:+ start:320 stop:583 length:264 start_codon:yes stop_codon:yes gene_type:complete